MPTPLTLNLVRAVYRRLRWASIGRACSFWCLVLGGVYGLVLLTGRLLGFAPFLTTWQTLAVVPALAVVFGLLARNRPTSDEAAHQIDLHAGSKDLFLTWSLLDRTAGEYQPIVAAEAERKAPRIEPAKVVPFGGFRRVGYAAALLAGLMLATLFMPQFDPFGHVAQQEQKAAAQKELEDARRATKTRVAQLKEDEESHSESESQAEQSVKELKATFRKMKPSEPEANLERLSDQQTQIGKEWRRLGSEKLKTLLSQDLGLQDFGGDRSQKLSDWSERLKDGDSKLVREEIDALADLAKQIAATNDPAKRSELMREMTERLKDLERFASERAGSKEMAAAVRRAMRQMDAAGKETMDEQMLQDLAESLELSKMEMEQIAQAAADMKKLEKALETLQMAKQANQGENGLNGDDCEACQTLEDYAELYAKMMGDNPADGTGGEGQGRGGNVPEAPDDVAFQDEQSHSPILAGKSLLTLKTKGLGEDGAVREDYREQIEVIRQSVSEAILQEQVPPGYHDAIRGYFDSIQTSGE